MSYGAFGQMGVTDAQIDEAIQFGPVPDRYRRRAERSNLPPILRGDSGRMIRAIAPPVVLLLAGYGIYRAVR